MKQKIEGGCEEKHFWKQGEKGDFCICGKPFFDDIHSNPETKRAGSAVIFVCPKCEYPEESCHCISPEELQKIKASERQRCVEARKENLYEGAYAFLRYYIQPMIAGTSGSNQTYKEMLKLLPQFKNKYIANHTTDQAKQNLEQMK